jgi:hypothetical protein
MNWLNKDEAVTALETFPFPQVAQYDGPPPKRGTRASPGKNIIVNS